MRVPSCLTNIIAFLKQISLKYLPLCTTQSKFIKYLPSERSEKVTVDGEQIIL